MHLWKEIKSIGETNQVEIYKNPKDWFTGELMIIWLKHNFSDDVEIPKLLLLDDFSAYWTTDFLATANRLNVTQMKIPPGFASVSQPADISWNKPLKGYLKTNWTIN